MSEEPSKVKKERINIFKIGKLWCFKHFFDDREIFSDMADYYHRESYRFELENVAERNKVIAYLEDKGFEPVPIEDTAEYTVKIDKFKKYAPILRDSVDSTESGKDRVFVMKDLAAVEEAITRGAEKVKEG
jgi:hypothetical protein